MRHKFSAILLLMIVFTAASAQSSKDNSRIFLHGKILDGNSSPLPGASVIIQGTTKGVNSNENGEYYLYELQPGNLKIQASCIGFKTLTIEIPVKAGENYQDFTLAPEDVHLDPVIVVARKREQQLLDVPAAISTAGSGLIEKANITDLNQLSSYIPGLLISELGANRPSFVIRGLTSDDVSPSAQPRVSVFFNNVPINRANAAAIELFDMARVEVMKGPQNTLFGRGAQIGAIHFISEKPVDRLEGYLTAGLGQYNQKEFRGAVNIPLISEKLFIRAAGVYDFRDGYVENTFGGTLNGKNTTAGRLSASFIPDSRQKLDLVLNYQKDKTPGIAFMSRRFPNTLGDTSIFSYRASLEQGKNLGTGKDLFDATLTYRYEINENTYWSSISSYRKASTFAKWDGDGTAAAAIYMSEDAGAGQFYQELRYNYSLKSRLNGSAGASYWHEKADQTYWFSPNEQNMVNLFLDPSYLILPNGQPLAMPALPNIPALGPLAGLPLPVSHQENSFSDATNQAAEAFFDATFQLSAKLYVTGGMNVSFEKYILSNQAAFIGGSPSTLGMMTGNYPNLFFRPSDRKTMDKTSLSSTWQAGLQYRLNEHANIFANYSKGRRPNVLQFTSAGTPQVLKPEKVDNLDFGFKSYIMKKIYLDVVAFYQKYLDFQTSAWIADPSSGEFNYIVKDGGRATSYGTEISLRTALAKNLDVFANYVYLHATFDKTDSEGAKQQYAGNTFRLSPDHSLSAGFNARVNITRDVQLFLTPTYIYKTHIYFEDANTSGLDQPGYGLLNINCGTELKNKVILSIYSTNILNEKFITSAGNTGSLFGVPTFVPGPPRMIGTKFTWKF